MVERADALLAELQARHCFESGFRDRLRPLVERILAEDTPAARRPELLGLVAETCERQVRIARSTARMRTALEGILATWSRLIAENSALRDRLGRNV